jgi:hypothetical protein
MCCGSSLLFEYVSSDHGGTVEQFVLFQFTVIQVSLRTSGNDWRIGKQPFITVKMSPNVNIQGHSPAGH